MNGILELFREVDFPGRVILSVLIVGSACLLLYLLWRPLAPRMASVPAGERTARGDDTVPGSGHHQKAAPVALETEKGLNTEDEAAGTRTSSEVHSELADPKYLSDDELRSRITSALSDGRILMTLEYLRVIAKPQQRLDECRRVLSYARAHPTKENLDDAVAISEACLEADELHGAMQWIAHERNKLSER